MNNATMQAAEVLTLDTFRKKYNTRAMLMVLVGEGRGCQLLRLATDAWEQFPAYFPEMASIILDREDPRAAAWDIMQIIGNEVYGGYDLWEKARNIALADGFGHDPMA